MEKFDDLADRVRQAAEQLVSLKRERTKLVAELGSLRAQVKDRHELARENDRFRRERDQLRTKLVRLNKRLETLLSPEMRVSDAV